ncbi:MAG: hypothetical protein QM820_17800 [Minicystis sp.]
MRVISAARALYHRPTLRAAFLSRRVPMRLWQYGVGISLALGLGLGLGGGCAAGGNNTPTGTGGSGTGGNGTGTGGGLITTSSASSSGAGGAGGFGECAKFNAEAKQAPAAMLIVLDRTASMAGAKWSAAQLAIVQAIDKDVFDTMSLGMLTFPQEMPVPGPECIFKFPIFCDVSGLPQIPVNPAGTAKSSAGTGVRHDIYQYLASKNPVGDASDSSPIYSALNGAYTFIKTVPNVDKRMVVLITDGGGSCTSVANPPRPAYVDNNGCSDWEQPPVMSKLISDARLDPSTPVNTFIVGVPGSNSTGKPVGGVDTPPYHMLLALSTYAVAGSPETVDPSCDKDLVFSQTALDPAHPCHVDLSNGNNFNADALASAITTIRGKALGCSYDLPKPPQGETIDPNQVNVVVTIEGMDYVIPKRKDPNDMCGTDPCWDYNDKGQVELIGITCSSVSAANNAKVEIYVGCATIVK